MLRSTAREDETAPRARAALSRNGEARDGEARRDNTSGENSNFCGDNSGGENSHGGQLDVSRKKNAGRGERSYRGATACLADCPENIEHLANVDLREGDSVLSGATACPIDCP